MAKVKSILIWTAIALLVIFWTLLMSLLWLLDRDEVKYQTGRMYRRLGKAITRVNPQWKLTITGNTHVNMRNPFVVVGNHQSLADIPLISNLPWEMKWVAKKELFSVPLIGWMLRLAGDIAVDRKAADRFEKTNERAIYYLKRNCSVMFFPEGTRSKDGLLGNFNAGAFHIAITQQVPILPIVVEGTGDCIPKNSWVFTSQNNVNLHVLDPIPTEGLTLNDLVILREKVRMAIAQQIAEWRNTRVDLVLRD